jgi:hypothetical protein
MDSTWYDRIADPEFLRALPDRSMDELRSMRSACGEIEAQLSYARRLVQGRLDIVEAERVRRSKGLPASNLAELVAALPAMMASKLQTSGAAFRSRDIGTSEDPALEIRLDQILDGGALVSLPTSTDEQLAVIAARLSAFERQVSMQRRQALVAFDTLSSEVIRRFRDGEVSVDSILQ